MGISTEIGHDQNGNKRSPARVEQIRKNRRRAGLVGGVSVATFVALAYLGGAFGGNENNANSVTANEEHPAVCIPVGEHEVTVQPGEGINDLVYQVQGSGEGPGADCWDDTVALVDEQVGQVSGSQPEAGTRLKLPNAMVPLEHKEQK